jgi:hypothetical protein
MLRERYFDLLSVAALAKLLRPCLRMTYYRDVMEFHSMMVSRTVTIFRIIICRFKSLHQTLNYGSFNGIDMKRCYINVRAFQLSGRCAHLILSTTGTFLLPSFQVMEQPSQTPNLRNELNLSNIASL